MSEKIYDICIIGAGASGLVAAIESSRRGLSCVVVDKNKKAAQKLYATGNGRCNLTNDNWEEDSYYENEFVDQVFDSLYKLTGMRQRTFVLDYFKKLGIMTVSRDGYFYPASMQASSVVWALLEAVRTQEVEMRLKTTCRSVKATNIEDILDELDFSDQKAFDADRIYKLNLEVKNENEIYDDHLYARNIIISTGGISQSKLGASSKELSEGLFDSLKLPYNEFRSCLCPVICSEDDMLSSIAGVRTKARIYVDNHSEMGELMITEDGISGIVTFNMSYYMKAGSRVRVNLLPKISEDDFVEHFNSIQTYFPNKRLDSFLNGYINDKLALYMIGKFYGNPELKLLLKDVTETGIRGLYSELTEWILTVRTRYNTEHSQASSGGIVTEVIDPKSMKISRSSTIGDGIYATGEATDVIGRCGGYNLSYAFITGYLAGNSVR